VFLGVKPVHPAERGFTFENSALVLLNQGEKHSYSITNAAQGCRVLKRAELAETSKGKRSVLMRGRGDSVRPERDLCFLFKIRGVADSFKKNERGEGYDFFAREDRFRFFFVFSLFSEKLPPFQYFSPPPVYYGRRSLI
jgi:hypothetical protein